MSSLALAVRRVFQRVRWTRYRSSVMCSLALASFVVRPNNRQPMTRAAGEYLT